MVVAYTTRRRLLKLAIAHDRAKARRQQTPLHQFQISPTRSHFNASDHLPHQECIGYTCYLDETVTKVPLLPSLVAAISVKVKLGEKAPVPSAEAVAG